jgi:putative transposase
VRLAISDAHAGLRAAIGQVLGAQWQRCAVHFVRDMLGHVPRSGQPLVRRALKQIFAAPDRASAGQTLARVVEQLERVAPKVARLVAGPEEELRPTCASPASTGPSQKHEPAGAVNREIARRSDVVGIYPNDAALLRLASGLLVEVNDEWLVAHRYISLGSLAQLEAEQAVPCGPAGAD